MEQLYVANRTGDRCLVLFFTIFYVIFFFLKKKEHAVPSSYSKTIRAEIRAHMLCLQAAAVLRLN